MGTGLGLTTGSAAFVVDMGVIDEVVRGEAEDVAAAAFVVVVGVFAFVVETTFCAVEVVDFAAVEVVDFRAAVVGVGVEPQETPETLS